MYSYCLGMLCLKCPIKVHREYYESINASLILGEQDWDRANFQIGVSDLIKLIMEGRLRHPCGPAQLKYLFGNFLRLSMLIFFINYFCLQKKLSRLIAISFSSSWKLGFRWVLGSLLIRNTCNFQLFNLSIKTRKWG